MSKGVPEFSTAFLRNSAIKLISFFVFGKSRKICPRHIVISIRPKASSLLHSTMFYVYIISNWNHVVLYTGFTNNIEYRIYQHKYKLTPGFTSKYNCNKLLYFEEIGSK